MQKILILLISLSSLLTTACHQVTLVVKKIPENTPPGAVLFIAGNFNYWDPGDQRFALKLNPDSTYSVTLPRGDGTINYRFTRGDWHSSEGDRCGNQMHNRSLHYRGSDTVSMSIESWKDLGPVHCDQVTIVIEKLPPRTPTEDPIYMTGTFNQWTPNDSVFRLQRTTKGKYFITVPRAGAGAFNFKFTRGSWLNEEVDEYGNLIPNRHFVYGRQDTVRVEIGGWKDFKSINQDVVTLLVKVPANTPVNDNIYVATNYSGWFARDPTLSLRKEQDSGLYTINIPRIVPYMEFKFTRGDWATVEGDRFGNDIVNRTFTFGRKDTLRLRVESWRDVGPVRAAK